MENLSEAYFKSITLKIPVGLITEDFIDKLDSYTNLHTGNQRMNLVLLDEANKVALSSTVFPKILINQLLIELVVSHDLEFDVEMN